MNRFLSESLVLTLSKEVDDLTSYQSIAKERIMKSISPILQRRLRYDLEIIHRRLVEIYQSFDVQNFDKLTISARLLYEQSKRATQRSSSLRLTCS